MKYNVVTYKYLKKFNFFILIVSEYGNTFVSENTDLFPKTTTVMYCELFVYNNKAILQFKAMYQL